MRKEKLEENQLESDKARGSQNGSPTNDSPILNLSKNKRDRSNSPEYEGNVGGNSEAEHNSLDVDDASDMEVSESSLRSRSPTSPPNLNNKLNFHQRDFPRPPPSIAFPSTEILLRNIQELLKVVLENSIQHEQQISFEKGRREAPLECPRTETSHKNDKSGNYLLQLAAAYFLCSSPFFPPAKHCNK